MSNFKIIKYFGAILLVGIMIVSQQNCSPGTNSFSGGSQEAGTLPSTGSNTLGDFFTNEGNGDGYSGKASYYAYDSNGSCSASSTVRYYAQIDVDYALQTATLLVMNCELIQPQAIDPQEIDFSDDDPGTLMYDNLIYYLGPSPGSSGG